MRQIGTLPRAIDPQPLTDHLTTLGMKTRVDDRPEGWAVWVHDEDHLPAARREFEAFVENPEDPRYRDASKSAREIRLESRKLDKQYRKNMRELSGTWDRPTLRRRPLTVLLIAVSVLVYLVENGGQGGIYHRLAFSTAWVGEDLQPHSNGLEEIRHGEVWRLVTPIFLHFSIMHLIFNVWWLRDLGTLIEYRRGTMALALIVLFTAIASNAGQFAYEVHAGRPWVQFGGMSGVVYALFGYVWLKGLHEPEQGMMVHPRTVQLMLFWLVLCFTGAVGPVANVAHLVGLAAGILFGLARF